MNFLTKVWLKNCSICLELYKRGPRLTQNKINQSGASLVEVLVFTGISFIVAFGIITLQLNQTRENRALSERLASLDFVRSIISDLASFSQCNKLLDASNIVGGVSNLTFDATLVSAASPYILNLNNVWGILPGIAVSPLSSTVMIDPNGGLFLEVASPSSATLHINFVQSNLMRPIKGLSFPVNINSSGPLGNTTITGCMSGNSVGGACAMGIANGEGSQRYNATGHFFEYCDGSTWKKLGGGLSYCTTVHSLPANTPSVAAACAPGHVLTGGGCISGTGAAIIGGGPGVSGGVGSPSIQYVCYNAYAPVTITAIAVCCH